MIIRKTRDHATKGFLSSTEPLTSTGLIKTNMRYNTQEVPKGYGDEQGGVRDGLLEQKTDVC